MALGGLTREYSFRDGGGGDSSASRRVRGGVELELADYAGLDSQGLIKLVFQADCAKRKLEGYLVGLLSCLGELEGAEAVQHLCAQFGLGRHRARRQAKTASTLSALPRTLDAAKEGFISTEHAHVIGESHQRAPLNTEQEIALITVAIKQDLDVFKRTAARSEDERQADGGLSREERQRQRRSAKVFDGDNDMVILHAELDRISGERVKTALDGLSDRMFRHDHKTGNDRTHEQRQADALVALVTQRPERATSGSEANSDEPGESGSEAKSDASVGSSGQTSSEQAKSKGSGSESGRTDCEITPQATTLLVKVDYDTLSGQLCEAGLIDGTPISVDEIRRIACDAHHIDWWENGGPTDLNNLVLLCPRCHKKVHKEGYTVDTHHGGKHQHRPPP